MDDFRHLTEEVIPRLLVNQLKDLCRTFSLKISGTKATLVKRLQDHLRDQQNRGETSAISTVQNYHVRRNGTSISRMNSPSSIQNQGSHATRITIKTSNNHGNLNNQIKSGGSNTSNHRSSFTPFENFSRQALPPLDTHSHPLNPSFQMPYTSSAKASPNGSKQTAIQKLPSNLPTSYYQSIVFKKSPFYDVIERIIPGKPCNASPEKCRMNIDFYFTPAQINKLDMDHSGPYQVRFFCCAAPDTDQDSMKISSALVEFPGMCELFVNGHQIQASLRGLKNKPGTVQPPDITNLCYRNSKNTNKLEFIYANTTKPYIVMVQLVRKISVETIVNEIKKSRPIRKDEVLNNLKRKAEDTDLVATSSVISLKDPLCHVRINLPCRSRHCNHIQCFDAVYFFQMNEQTPTWTCPVCNNLLCSDDIALDGYFSDILEKVPKDQESITIEANGEWSLKPPSPEPVITKARAQPLLQLIEPEIVVIDDDSGDEKPNKNTPTINKDKKQPIIIDLTLDDEDEQPPYQSTFQPLNGNTSTQTYPGFAQGSQSPLYPVIITPQRSSSSSGLPVLAPSTSPMIMTPFYDESYGSLDINSGNQSSYYDLETTALLQNSQNTVPTDDSVGDHTTTLFPNNDITNSWKRTLDTFDDFSFYEEL